VVVFEELGTTFAQVEQQMLVLHYCKSRAHHHRLEMPGRRRCNSRELAGPKILGVALWATAYWD